MVWSPPFRLTTSFARAGRIDPVREHCASGATSVACSDFSLTGLDKSEKTCYNGYTSKKGCSKGAPVVSENNGVNPFFLFPRECLAEPFLGEIPKEVP